MERFAWPSDRFRKPLLIFLQLVAVLLAVASLVLKLAFHQSGWSNVAAASFYGMYGLAIWFFPEITRLSDFGRRAFAVSFWAFSAFLLFY